VLLKEAAIGNDVLVDIAYDPRTWMRACVGPYLDDAEVLLGRDGDPVYYLVEIRIGSERLAR
jgi:hypothetical protein